MTHIMKFQKTLTEKGFDAAIVSDKINQRYLSGFDFDDGLVLVTAERAYLLTDFRYIEAAKAQCSDKMEVIAPEHGHLACIRGILEEGGFRKVAVEENALSLNDYDSYRAKLPGAVLEPGASAMLGELRRFKDETELETMAKAQAITDAAFAHILNFIQPQMTEMEIALELEFFMRRNGAEAEAFQTIAVSGSASSRPHGVPRRCKLEKGFLTMDFGAKVDGYCSDMTRTVVIGKADAEMKKLYNTVLKAQLSALEQAAEGTSCSGLDRVARDIIEGNAEYKGTFGHSLGHGVGMFIHETPRLSGRAAPDEVLERGHVVTVEPGIYLEGKYGCRIEDMIAVRHDGSILNFTKSPKELIEI